jgi:hypothetical protein
MLVLSVEQGVLDKIALGLALFLTVCFPVDVKFGWQDPLNFLK